MKNDLIFNTEVFYNEHFHETVLILTMSFLKLSPTSGHLHPLQVENCDSDSRLVVDEDDYGKLRLERVNIQPDKRTFDNILPTL